MSSRSFWEHWNFGNNSALPINQSIMQLCLEILAMANLQKNRISEFSPNSPFSSKLPFPRAPLPSHLPWKLYFGEFLPYSSNWPLSSKSLLWTAPLCHIIWLVHITMANFCDFQSFRQIFHFRQNRQSQMGPLIIFNFTCSKGFGEVSPYSPFSSWTRLSNFSYRRRLDQVIQLYIRFIENSYSVICLFC